MASTPDGAIEIHWNTRELNGRLLALGPAIEAGIRTVLGYWRPRIESAAKSTAPWQDQTGNARNGLTAEVSGGRQTRDSQGRFLSGGGTASFTLSLSHSVPYGIFLETRWSGRYAVIMPTINDFADDVFQSFDGMLGRLS